jgi:polysaccharide biosynthesis transport protein
MRLQNTMLTAPDHLPSSNSTAANRFAVHMASVTEWDLQRMISTAKRQRRTIVTGVASGLVLAIVYIVVATPKYTAIVDILLDTPKVAAVADSYSDGNSAIGFETGGIDSQVELLKSDRIALGVLKKLDLKKNPAFAPQPNFLKAAFTTVGSFFSSLFGGADDGLDSAAAAEAERVLESKIIKQLSDKLDVKRLGRTYVLELKFTDPDTALANSIANTYASQYLVDQLDAKYDATTRAANWLQDRISELHDKSLAADSRVQKFRADHGLVSVDGKLVDEQQLVDANSQLSDARSKMADADAKAQRIETILKSGSIDAAVTESLANPVIADLRTKYLTTSKKEAEITKKLGADHIAAVNLRNDMRQYERLLFDELGRIGESYRSDFQIAKARLESLEKNFQGMMTQANANNETQVTLRDLIRESDTYKTLYETFLQRYQQAIQQQSFPINDARVITVPNPPLDPSWPKKPLVLALGLVLGTMAGVGGAVLREMRDRVFRTGEQIQSELGLEFLGLLPALAVSNQAPRKTEAIPGVLGPISPSLRYSISEPLSGFAETLRATKVAADIALRGKRPKIIGVVSVIPSEGKTTVSKNFASLIASLGSKTILIDADLRNPGLSRSLVPDATDGLVELLRGTKSISELALVEKESGLTIVPAVVHRRTTNSSDLLSSEAMRHLLTRLGEHYDYIVLDLPPLGPVIDVRAAADLFDAFVFVVEWGKTERALVRSTLEMEPEVMDKCLGVILNKVDQVKMRLYEGSEYRNYYYSKYTKYYTS